MKKLILAVAIVGMTGFAFGQTASTSKDSKATTKSCNSKCCKKGSCTKDSKSTTSTTTKTTSDKK